MPEVLGLLLPLFVAKSARKRLRKTASFLTVIAFTALSLGTLVSGCGGSSTPATTTPVPQTYTVAVTATDQVTGVKGVVNLKLTVQ
jgi:hypothetical protein